MIITEEEAKTKRCQESFPAASSLSIDGRMFNGGPYPMMTDMTNAGSIIFTAPMNCIGSACMAWRWEDYTDDHLISGACKEYDERHADDGPPPGVGWVKCDPDDREISVVSPGYIAYERPDFPKGYCGKAGKP